MAVVDDNLIRGGIRSLVTQAASWPAICAWENVETAPPNPPALWAAERALSNDEFLLGTGLHQATGIVEYDIMVPKGDSVESTETLIAQIRALCYAGLSFTFEGVVIDIVRVEPGRGSDFSDAWWYRPLFITWRVFVYQ